MDEKADDKEHFDLQIQLREGGPFALTGSPTHVPVRDWHCTRGHSWRAAMKLSGLTFRPVMHSGYNTEATVESIPVREAEDFCLVCWWDWARRELGQVREGERRGGR